jgi:hypothetical protein
MNIHEKINRKIGVFKEQIPSDILPFSYCVKNREVLIDNCEKWVYEKERDSIFVKVDKNDVFIKTTMFIFGTKELCRTPYQDLFVFEDKNLKDIYEMYKYSNTAKCKKQFQRFLDYQDYFKIY